MSSENKDPEVIIAAGLGANKGFWMVQLRDRLGQFAEMGRFQLMLARLKRGLPPVPINGKYIGASDKIKGFARILIEGFGDKGFKDGVYHVPTSKMESFEALIPKEDLIRQGIQPGQKLDSQGNPIISREWSEKDFLDYENTLVDPITDADRELADATPTDEEKQIIEEERAKSPLAKLPPGAEADMTEEELSRLIENMPSEEVAPAGELTPEERQANIDAWREFGREHAIYRKVAGEKNKKKETKARRAELESKYPIFKADEALKDKLDSLPNVTKNQEKIKELKDARKLLNERTINSLKSGDESPTSELPYNFDDLLAETPEEAPSVVGDEIDSAAGRAIQDAMDGKPVDVDQVIEQAKKEKTGAPALAPGQLDESDIEYGEEVPEEPAVPSEAPEEVEEFKPPTADGQSTRNLSDTERESDPMTDVSFEASKKARKRSSERLGQNVPKVTEAELDELAKRADWTRFTEGYEPSDEQKRAMAALVFTDKDTVLDALAGAGKTATVVAAVKAKAELNPDDGVLVLTFGRKNAADAKARLPKENCTAMTQHKLAQTALKGKQQTATRVMTKNRNQERSALVFTPDAIAAHLGIDDTPGGKLGNIDSYSGAVILTRIMRNFCNSRDEKPNEYHVLKAFSDRFDMDISEFIGKGEKKRDDGIEAIEIDYDKWLGLANKYLDDVNQTALQLGKFNYDKKVFVGNKRLLITQDMILKIWQLSKPDLSKLKVGKNNLPVKLVIIDEGQDTNSTVAAVMQDNKGKVQRAVVGDTNQNIFTWRGAENYINDSKPEAPVVQNLTICYRMPEEMVEPGNAFLNLLGDDKRLVGNPGIDGSKEIGIVDTIEQLPIGPDVDRAHLTRTNIGAAEAIIEFDEKGKKVALLSSAYDEIRSNIYYIEWLFEDFKTRSKNPTFPDGKIIESNEFLGINTAKEFITRAEKDPGSAAGKWHTFRQMNKDKYDKVKSLLETILVDKSDVGGDITADLDTSIGESGILWISKSGKPVEYEVDEFGKLAVKGQGMREFVNGEEYYKAFKARGWKYNKFNENAWEFQTRDDDERQEELDILAALIPNRLDPNKEKNDVVIGTSHRAKGMEWDYVSLQDDYIGDNIKADDKRKKRQYDLEELRVGYVAVTRAKRGMYLGRALDYAMSYAGRQGLGAANAKMGRDGAFGEENWDRKDKITKDVIAKQEADATKKPKLSSSLGSSSRKGDIKVDQGEESIIPTGRVSAPSTPPKGFLTGWQKVGSGDREQYSKLIDGVRWEVTVNKDGTALLRNRTDRLAPSKKYNNLNELAKDFNNSRSQGIKNNRELAKTKLSPYDPTGKIAKLIDAGADGDKVIQELLKDPNFVNDLDQKRGALTSVVAAAEKLNNGKSLQSKNSSRLKKPKKASVVVTPTPHSTTADLWTSNPTRQDNPNKGIPFRPINIPKAALASRSTTGQRGIQDALLAINPDATVKPDGSIVWFRTTNFTEPKESRKYAGKKAYFEVCIVPNQNNEFRVTYKYIDLTTGKTENFVGYNTLDSLTSILGSAGPQAQLEDHFLRDYKINPRSKDPKKQAQDERYYSGIRGGIDYLNRGNFDNILADPGSDDSSVKLRTPEQEAKFILGGRRVKYNASTSAKNGGGEQFLNVMRKGLPSFWEALDNRNQLDALNILQSYVANLPDTQEARDVAKKYILKSLREKFADLGEREFIDQYGEMTDFIENKILGPVGGVVTPHRLATGEIANVGDIVRWPNNLGLPSVGQIIYKAKVEYDANGDFSYGNYVDVDFGVVDENGESEKPVRLVAGKLSLLPPETPLQRGRKTVRRDQKVVERALEEGYIVDFDRQAIFDKDAFADNKQIEPVFLIDTDAIDFKYIDYSKYGNQIIGSPSNSRAAKISDVAPGDTVYDQIDARLGTVQSVKKVTQKKTGLPATEIKFSDGTTKTFLDDTDVKISSKVYSPAPGKLTSLGNRAADIGIGVDNTGKAPKTLPINAPSPTTTTPVRDSDKVAVKPTDEARAAKDEVVSVGDQLRERIDERIAEILKDQKGIKTVTKANVDKFLDDLVSNSARVEKEKITAENNRNSVQEAGIKGFSSVPSNLASITDPAQRRMYTSMNADGLITSSGDIDKDKLQKLLDDAGLWSIGSRVKESSPGNNSLFFYAYDVLKDKAKSARMKTLQKNLEMKAREARDARKARAKGNILLGEAGRQAYREIMAEEGVELDNVSLTEFKDLLFSEERKLPLRPDDTFKAKRALEQTLDVLPSSVIRGVIALARQQGKKIFIMSGEKRAFVREEPDGYHIHLSNHRSSTQEGHTTATEASIHENAHVWGEILPNVNQIQHAWQYDRSVTNPGTPDEMIPPLMQLSDMSGGGYASKEKAVAIKDLAEPYMGKQYGDNPTILDPSNPHNEVVTMAVQDVLANFGVASKPKGIKVKYIDENGVKQITEATYDPKRDVYVSKLTGKDISNVTRVWGRDPKLGTDNDVRNLAYGLLFSLADRQPAVSAQTPVKAPKPSASATNAIKKGAEGSPDGGAVSDIVDRFSGSDGELSRGELTQLVNFLRSELENTESSKYNQKELTSLRSYLAKIVGL